VNETIVSEIARANPILAAAQASSPTPNER